MFNEYCLSNVAFCYLPSQRFVIEVKTKGGSKYFIYRRYREFFNLHQILESKYSSEIPDRTGPNTCVLPSLPGEFLFKALIITDESSQLKNVTVSAFTFFNVFIKEL